MEGLPLSEQRDAGELDWVGVVDQRRDREREMGGKEWGKLWSVRKTHEKWN